MARLTASEIEEELSIYDAEDTLLLGVGDPLGGQLEHIPNRERCIFCGVNVYDVGLPGVPSYCSREPIAYSTEAGGAHPGMIECVACNGQGSRYGVHCDACAGYGEVPTRWDAGDSDW